MKLQHTDIEPLLTAYALGDCAETNAAEIRAHLETCEICKAALAELQATVGLLKEALATVPTPATLTAEQRQEILHAHPSRTPKILRWFTQSHPRMARAASILIVFSLIWVISGQVLWHYTRQMFKDFGHALPRSAGTLWGGPIGAFSPIFKMGEVVGDESEVGRGVPAEPSAQSGEERVSRRREAQTVADPLTIPDQSHDAGAYGGPAPAPAEEGVYVGPDGRTGKVVGYYKLTPEDLARSTPLIALNLDQTAPVDTKAKGTTGERETIWEWKRDSTTLGSGKEVVTTPNLAKPVLEGSLAVSGLQVAGQPVPSDVVPDTEKKPASPGGGTYTYQRIGAEPSCNISVPASHDVVSVGGRLGLDNFEVANAPQPASVSEASAARPVIRSRGSLFGMDGEADSKNAGAFGEGVAAKEEGKVPMIGDIPILGGLFKDENGDRSAGFARQAKDKKTDGVETVPPQSEKARIAKEQLDEFQRVNDIKRGEAKSSIEGRYSEALTSRKAKIMTELALMESKNPEMKPDSPAVISDVSETTRDADSALSATPEREPDVDGDAKNQTPNEAVNQQYQTLKTQLDALEKAESIWHGRDAEAKGKRTELKKLQDAYDQALREESAQAAVQIAVVGVSNCVTCVEASSVAPTQMSIAFNGYATTNILTNFLGLVAVDTSNNTNFAFMQSPTTNPVQITKVPLERESRDAEALRRAGYDLAEKNIMYEQAAGLNIEDLKNAGPMLTRDPEAAMALSEVRKAQVEMAQLKAQGLAENSPEMVKEQSRMDGSEKYLSEVMKGLTAKYLAEYQAAQARYDVLSKTPENKKEEDLTGPRFKAFGVNQFINTVENAFSTFSIGVDTASYTVMRNYMAKGFLPPAESVRTEEFVNFFDYDYKAPTDAEGATFRIFTQCAPSKFGHGMDLLKIGVKGRRLGREQQRPSVLTFLVDTSGSMDTPDRLGLVKKSLKLLVAALAPQDRVTIIQYNTHARLILEMTPASDKATILAAIDGMECSGSTNLEEGMGEAYAIASRNFTPGAENRVLLMSDGVANLGTDKAEEILNKVADARKQGIYCSVLGFGIGNYDDAMLQTLASKGDGVYTFIDSEEEAKRVLVDDLSATLNTIAADVKIQVEFNPAFVAQYRQLGYESRQLKKQDFRNDSVDAGEIGSGQSVTALYELSLAALQDAHANRTTPIATVRVRYRRTDNRQVEEIKSEVTLADILPSFEAADARFRLAACVAEFSEILRGSPFAEASSFSGVAEVLRPVAQELYLDSSVKELLTLIQSANGLLRGE